MHHQQTFDFERPHGREANEIAESTSLPPPSPASSGELEASQAIIGEVPTLPVPAANSHYSFEEFIEFLLNRDNCRLTFAEYRSHFERLVAAKGSLLAEFQAQSKRELVELAAQLGILGSRYKRKADVAQSLYREMLTSFVWDGTISYGMNTSLETAILAKVRSATPLDIAASQQKLKKDLAQHAKALQHPETFYEFRTVLSG